VLKTLRIRLVAIITAMVGIVVLGMVCIGFASAQSSFDSLVERSLDRALEERNTLAAGADSDAMGMEHLPVLWVDVSIDGTTIGSNQSQFSVDAETMTETLEEALESNNEMGRTGSLHVTWKKQASEFGWRIAIADTTSIDSEKARQLATSVALALGGEAVVFVIAMVLSKWALAPVKTAWEQQHQFVADASHELKTPLAVILANTQILQKSEGEMPEDCRRWVEGTAEEAERMRGLVESLLELARTEESAGTARRNVDVDFSSVVEGEALQFDAVAFELGCSIETDVAADIHVMGDPDQLQRLTKTLVDNACKYAKTGTEVRVKLAHHGSTAELTVNNLGDPIAPEDLPHVFDRFYRSDKARARETGGFGLGLAIAHGIVEGHGGKISVTSTEAEGTTFTVKLPVASRVS
jgi:two-component system, OmpR family, sensor histidine kinase CiaH